MFLNKLMKILGLFLIALTFACSVNPVTGEKEIMLMSESEEIQVGQQNYGPYLQSLNGVYQNDHVKEYLNSIGLQLVRVSHRPHLPYEFNVANASMLNAWALPGGKIAFTRGLMSEFKSEAQLAAIMGHEITHVTAKHTASRWTKQVLANIAMQIGSAYLYSKNEAYRKNYYLYNTAAMFGLNLAFMAYGRAQESQADVIGMSYAVKAGFDPIGAVEVHQMFQKAFNEQPNGLKELFSTHPQSHKRIETTKEEINRKYASLRKNKKLTYNTPRFDEIRNIFQKEKPAYKKYDQAQAEAARGNYQGALPLYIEAVSMKPTEALFHADLGYAYMMTGQNTKAENQFRKAHNLYPGFAKSNLFLGQLKYFQRDYNASIGYLREADRLLPGSPQVHLMLGEGYENTGQTRTAVEYYNSAFKKSQGTDLGNRAYGHLRRLGVAR